MSVSRAFALRIVFVVVAALTLLTLAACRTQTPDPLPTAAVATAPAPQAQATAADSAATAVAAAPTSQDTTAVRARPTPTPGRIAGLGLASFARASEPLKILTTLPADQADGVPVGGAACLDPLKARGADCPRIVVQFNHPVVPLTGVADAAMLPSPITLTPAAQGRGEWLNTSTYVFRPDFLQPSTKYTVTVNPISDLVGAKLDAPQPFSFTTVYPAVLRRQPSDGAAMVSATLPISVTFNQAMNQADAQAAFSLRADDGSPVQGAFRWLGSDMLFTPHQPLARATRYTATVRAGAKDSAGREALRADTTWGFQTAPAPGLVASNPANGSTATRRVYNVELTFASPMDRDSLRVEVTPSVGTPTVFWSDENNMKAQVSGDFLPSAGYTVVVKGDARTRDGEALGQDVTLRFTNGPAEPRLALGIGGQVATYDANRAPALSIASINAPQADFRLYRLPDAELRGLLGRDFYQGIEKYQPAQANLVRQWSERLAPGLDAPGIVTTTLTTDKAALPVGGYLLTTASPQITERGAFANRHVLVVSPYNLLLKRTDREALVWATDLKTGQPVAGLALTLYDGGKRVLGRATTDAEGVARFQFAPLVDAYAPLIALAEQGGKLVGMVGGEWSEGINPYDFRLDSAASLPEYTGLVYSDRPLYRPGDTVHLKGIVRKGRDGAYAVPGGETVTFQVRDGQGRIVFKQALPITAAGTFAADVLLPAAAALGTYEATALFGPPPASDSAHPQPSANYQFQALEYRKPEFDVTVKIDKDQAVAGDTVHVSADTAYFFGGPVADAKVQWRLLVADRLYTPPDDVPGYWEFNDLDPLANAPFQRDRGVVKRGTGTTDAQGRFSVQVPTSLDKDTFGQTYTLEVEVTDANGQAVAGRRSLPVYPGGFHVGVRPASYVAATGKPQTVELLALDLAGKPLANQALSVAVVRREWQNVQQRQRDGRLAWTAVPTDAPVTSLTATTDAQGRASVSYTPSQAGTYRLVAEGRDAQGRAVRSATYQWVTGTDAVSWRLGSADRFNLTPDKKSYAPGETARLLAQVPFAPAEALLTVERGGIRQVRRLTLPTTSEIIEVPIGADAVPNLYVSLAAVQGGDDKALPKFRLGYSNLDVARDSRLLDVTLTPDRPGPYRPGDRLTYTITTKDAQGQPVPADLSLALVDKAIFSLAEDESRDPADVFYGRQPLGVQTAASLTRDVNRTTAQIIDGGGFGGGGGEMAPVGPVRQDFKDTAFWKADVTTDAQGKATVEVTLPDNLTTWVMTARGATSDTLVGQARGETLTTQDLIVRPALSRFLVQGDALRLSAVVQNNTDREIQARVIAQTTGLDGQLEPQQVRIPARGKATVAWDTVVGPVASASVTLAAEGGGLADTVAVTLPVYQTVTPETTGTAGVVTDRIAEDIRVPANAAPTLGGLAIQLDPSLAAVRADGLKYLEANDLASAEAMVSRFLPSVASVQAASAMGLPVDRPALEERVAADAQRLYTAQNPDGGWGWWQGETSNTFLSAYVLYGLTLAQRNGFTIASNVVERAQNYLTQAVAAPPDTGTRGALSQRAFALYALAESGRPDVVRSIALYNIRDQMSLYGQAYLLLALDRADAAGQAQRIQAIARTLADNVKAGATGAHWEESVPNPTTMNTDTRTTALALMALARVNPQDATLPNVVRWLMSARTVDGGWRTTQETAWALLALAEYMRGRDEKDSAYRYSVGLNGKDLTTGQVSAGNLAESQRVFQPLQDLQATVGNNLTLTKEGRGNLYYMAHLTTYVPAEQTPALDKGILVGRQYLAVDPATLKPTGKAAESVRVGDYVLARITLVAPETLHYVVVEDPLPAGFEAVDVSLRTASQAAQRPTLHQGEPTPAPMAGAAGVGGGENAPIQTFDQPYWSFWTHSEVRDNRVALYATQVSPGVYEYTYLMRAAAPGQFKALPATAYEMYFPERFGRSAAASFPIAPAE